MKTVAEIDAIRDRTKKMLSVRLPGANAMKLIVRMDECGLAKGAREIMNAFHAELHGRDLYNVSVLALGCKGDCANEPMAEVLEGDAVTVYRNLDAAKVRRIVVEHIVGGVVCADLAN
ncbi:MAG: (2Fe-2S) ferredoxin domain-containing protein [Oscillospiraceae bacterium]|nr:(2Fe-2S) ferredoxin domain-containing protein [Oscillospiraceae bacterium]